VLGTKAGVDPEIVLKLIAGGYAMRVLDVKGPLILKGDFKPGFKTKLHYKDLGVALEGCRIWGATSCHRAHPRDDGRDEGLGTRRIRSQVETK